MSVNDSFHQVTDKQSAVVTSEWTERERERESAGERQTGGEGRIKDPRRSTYEPNLDYYCTALCLLFAILLITD